MYGYPCKGHIETAQSDLTHTFHGFGVFTGFSISDPLSVKSIFSSNFVILISVVSSSGTKCFNILWTFKTCRKTPLIFKFFVIAEIKIYFKPFDRTSMLTMIKQTSDLAKKQYVWNWSLNFVCDTLLISEQTLYEQKMSQNIYSQICQEYFALLHSSFLKICFLLARTARN